MTSDPRSKPLSTDIQVRNARSMDKPYKWAAGGGLYLEVMPNGSRYWRMKYRFAGTEKRLALGVYPAVKLGAAKKGRDAAKQLLDKGIDPCAKRTASKLASELTFAKLAGEWLALRKVAVATATKDAWLVGMAVQAFGQRPAKDVTRSDVIALLQSLADRELLETARRLRSKLSNIFRYGFKYPVMTADPTASLPRGVIATPTVRHHAALTDPRKVGELLRSIEAYGGGLTTRCALRLAPLLFVRPGELRHAEWSEIDFDSATWRIPASKMKMRADHLVPLCAQAIGILQEVQALTGRGKLVFPSERSPLRPLSENTLTLALRAMGYAGDVQTAHGFRSIASTLLHEMGYPSDVIERQLAHKERNAIKGAYNRAEHLPDRRRMMQAWADYLDGLRAGGSVVPFARKA